MRKPFSVRKVIYGAGIAGACVTTLAAMLIESLIAAGPPSYCTADTVIGLKNGVYRTCWYLATLHKVTDWGFVASVAIVVIGAVARTGPDGADEAAPPRDR